MATGFDAKRIEVSAYNFASKPARNYTLLFRFKDAAGALVKPSGTSTDDNSAAWTGAAGSKFTCGAQSWCKFAISTVPVPESTKTVDIVATQIGSNGMDFDLFDLDKDHRGPRWPEQVR